MRVGGLELSLCGAPRHPGEERLYPGVRLLECLCQGEILTLPQLLSGNLWLVLSMSAEPEPKSLWFPGVTTTLSSREVERIVLALSVHTTSGLH